MKEWQGRNKLLQSAYKDYYFASKQRDKDSALSKIQNSLEWPPFMSFCEAHAAQVLGIRRYGLDYMSEKCIDLIDRIAKEEIKYDF